MSRTFQSRRARQGGFAMIAFVALAALMSTYFIVEALNRTNAEVRNAREIGTLDALQRAKAALIAYAISEEWQLYKGQITKQPGALPCPDTDGDGNGEGLCDSALSRVGRLPWKSIGLEDLRDSAGERLWYAVSSSFRTKAGTTVVNADTPGLLSVTGATPATDVVALVIAPGVPFQGQNRDPANPTLYNSLAAFLEGYTAGTDDYTFSTLAVPSDAQNDKIVVITQADLMAALEPVIAARIERDIKPYLSTYRDHWRGYPFATPFGSPGTSDLKGAAGQLHGLMPLTTEAGWIAWITTGVESPKISQAGGPGGTLGTWSCITSTTTQITCTASYTCGVPIGAETPSCPVLQVDATATHAGEALVGMPVVTARVQVGSDPPTVISISRAGGPQPVGRLFGDGSGRVSANSLMPGTLANPGGTVTFEIPGPTYDAATNPAFDVSANGDSSKAYWFMSNQWYRQVFYASSAALTPGPFSPPASTCSGNCLTVRNLSSPDDRQGILVLAGRSLNGSSRPSSSLADYLEGENATPADAIFEHRWGRPANINDRVVTLAP
ncbi:MAG: hypothetical protein IT514_06140 [Burkholderiales bacterium]|nr:hypothetical protein [Burkholderiales bacterium]